MAIQAHLVELERKHKILENELHEALVHPSVDDLHICELKPASSWSWTRSNG